MREVTYHAQLLAEQTDFAGYITYVFKNLDAEEYIMCVRFPNWEQVDFNIGDKGFVHVRFVIGGEDKWFDGRNFIPYNYTNVIFMKFLLEKPLKPNLEVD